MGFSAATIVPAVHAAGYDWKLERDSAFSSSPRVFDRLEPLPAGNAQPAEKGFDKLVDGGASALVPASFCSEKWAFPPQQSYPPYTPPGTIGSSREIRPSRALQGFSADLSHCPPAMLWITAHCSALAEHRLRRRADRCLFFFKIDIQHTPSSVIMAHFVFCACRLDGI